MAETITLKGTFVTEVCCHEGCGSTFAVTDDFHRARREDHGWFYCPRGHVQHYTSESDKARAERLAREANDALARERARHDQTRAALEHESHRARAARGIATRIRNRVSRGVCPCCNRTFGNLSKHMAMKHPTFVKEGR